MDTSITDTTDTTDTTDDARLARECLFAADDLIALAVAAARAGDARRASELTGRGSDAIARALYHLREAKRRAA